MMGTLRHTSRGSSPMRHNQGIYNNSGEDEEKDIFGFLVYLKNIFAPYLQRAITIADRYKIFDLLTYVFEENNEGEEETINPENDPEILKSMERCKHPAHALLKKGYKTNEMSVNYFSDLIENEHKDINAGTVAMIHYKMNSIYVKRLLQIHSKAPNNTSIKLVTYQEWVDVLLKLNKSLLKNVRQLENTILEHYEEVEEVQKGIKSELDDSRNDMMILINFIRTGLYGGNWIKDDLKQLKTIPFSRVIDE